MSTSLAEQQQDVKGGPQGLSSLTVLSCSQIAFARLILALGRRILTVLQAGVNTFQLQPYVPGSAGPLSVNVCHGAKLQVAVSDVNKPSCKDKQLLTYPESLTLCHDEGVVAQRV